MCSIPDHVSARFFMLSIYDWRLTHSVTPPVERHWVHHKGLRRIIANEQGNKRESDHDGSWKRCNTSACCACALCLTFSINSKRGYVDRDVLACGRGGGGVASCDTADRGWSSAAVPGAARSSFCRTHTHHPSPRGSPNHGATRQRTRCSGNGGYCC